MAVQRQLLDCDGWQQIPGIQAHDSEIIPSGKAFNCIPEDEESQAIYSLIKGHCDIIFITEPPRLKLDFYPVPIVWFFAYDSGGNYFGTLNGMGSVEDDEFPVVFVNSTTLAHGIIAESIKAFFSLANYYPFWREIINCEQKQTAYDMQEIEKRRERLDSERQKEIGEALRLSKDPNAIPLLIERIRLNPGFAVYESKLAAEMANEFITI